MQAIAGYGGPGLEERGLVRAVVVAGAVVAGAGAGVDGGENVAAQRGVAIDGRDDVHVAALIPGLEDRVAAEAA